MRDSIVSLIELTILTCSIEHGIVVLFVTLDDGDDGALELLGQ